MTGLLSDLRFAVRVLVAKPLHTLAIVLTLALAIGANAAIFSVVEAVLLQPLPYADAQRIAVMWATHGNDRRVLTAYSDVEEWRRQSRAFETIGVMRGQSVNLTGGTTPGRLGGLFVGADAFTVLGAHAALGRLFTSEESTPGSASEVVVLSHDAWTNRFGADPGIVGRALTLNARPHVVVGVLSADFTSPFGPTDVWLPIPSIPTKHTFDRGYQNVWAVGKLASGRTLRDAQTELGAIAARLAAEYPDTNAGVGTAVVSLREQVAGDVRPALLTILAAVIVVLLIACANIANLQLARGAARQREMSLRSALGASRSRLVRQLLTESLLVSISSGAVGLLLGVVATRALADFARDIVPAFGTIGIDTGVVVFSIALIVLTAIICGVSPAYYASHARTSSLGQRTTDDASSGRARRAFVVAELALALVLLVGAGLLARTIERLGREDPGFAPADVLTFQFRLPASKYADDASRAAFFAAALDKVRGVAGVTSAALVTATPFSGNFGQGAYLTDRAPTQPASGGPVAGTNAVSDGYFRTMRIPLVEGRDFEERDRVGTQKVAIVNAEFARREWPGTSAIGRRVRIVADGSDWLVVVGVAGNAKQIALSDAPTPQIYAPMLQQPSLFGNVVARTLGDPLASANAVRAAIWAVDPDQPVWSIRSMDELLARSTSQLRLTTTLGAAFAGAGLLLALIGVYGVMSFMVAQRTREVGIRLAIGAKPAQVVAMILAEGARITGIAIVIGWLAALAATRWLESQLFGVAAVDPATYAGIAAVLAAVALLACWLPARRAARVEPNVALRYE